jgi:hypothetical protein
LTPKEKLRICRDFCGKHSYRDKILRIFPGDQPSNVLYGVILGKKDAGIVGMAMLSVIPKPDEISPDIVVYE